MNIKIDISIIMINYKKADMTISAIESVFEKTEGVCFEIILIDNNSSDGSIEKIKNHFNDKIILIEAKENLGFGGANNIGIKIAKGKYIFLLNNDTLLINNAIKILFDFMETNDKVGVAGGNLYNLDGKPAFSFEKKFPKEKALFHLVFSGLCDILINILLKNYTLRKIHNFSQMPKKVGYIIGADMMIRKNILDETGCFDKDFFMFAEEAELTSRIMKSGFASYNIPHAKITHFEGGTAEMFSLMRQRMGIKSSLIFFYKMYGINQVKRFYRNHKFRLKYKYRKNKTLYEQYLKILESEYENFLNNKNKM